MIQVLLYNDLLSLSAMTAILEAADWDESVASKISTVINSIEANGKIDEAKSELRKRLLEEKINENIIDKIFILIEVEESKMKGSHALWGGLILKTLEI